jgi:hypothetical protein
LVPDHEPGDDGPLPAVDGGGPLAPLSPLDHPAGLPEGGADDVAELLGLVEVVTGALPDESVTLEEPPDVVVVVPAGEVIVTV